jgi:hypothetical protein
VTGGRAGWAVLVAAGLALGCQPKNNGTLLVVLVDSNLPAGQLDRIDVEVRPARGKGATHSFTPSPQTPPPFRLALVPEGDPALDVDIIARAMSGARATVTLVATVSFEPGAARETTMLLSRDCLESKAVVCPGAQQCVEGGVCLAKKQVAILRPLGTPPKDAGAPIDLGTPLVDAQPDRPPREAGVVTGTWTQVMAPAFAGNFTAVAPVSDKEVWAIGTGGPNGYAFRYNGTAWLSVPLPAGTSPLTGIWSAGPGDLWVVGYNGTILHRVGEVFSRLPSGVTANLNAVFGSGPNDVWFVGGMRTVLHWDGTSLTPQANGIVTELNAGTAVSATDAWVAGNNGGVYRRVGAAWVRQAEGMTSAVLFGIWASGANDVWAVGDGATLHFDGGGWAANTLGANLVGHAIWGTADNDVWAVGRLPAGFIAHFDGLAWTPVMIPPVGALLAVRGLGPNDIWAVGKDAILHYR